MSHCYQGTKCEHDEAKIKKNDLANAVTKLLSTGKYPMKDYHVINDNFVTSVTNFLHQRQIYFDAGFWRLSILQYSTN
jgi:hypothetical protein